MVVLVREAGIRREKRILTEFLSRYLSSDADERRYEWLYCGNPDGEGLAWLATTSDSDAIIGVAAAFPRRMYCAGEQVRSFVLGDFCIHPDYRSLGPALALQKACLKGLEATGAEFGFDFPSDAMLGIYKRLRIETRQKMIRYAKPLQLAKKISERLGPGVVSRGLAVAADLGLRMRDGMRRRPNNWTFTIEHGPWDEELTCATQRWSSNIGLCVARTSHYLNWRYAAHPQRKYEILFAWQSRKRCGYLIYRQDGPNGVIVDLLGENDEVCKALLVEMIDLARIKNLETLSAPWNSSHAGKALLEDCGFRARETRTLVLLPLTRATSRQIARAMDDWYVTDGDRES